MIQIKCKYMFYTNVKYLCFYVYTNESFYYIKSKKEFLKFMNREESLC